jgi:GT2 family glycosyltransferase
MTEASAADVAVVIVNYETGAWLERCLRSLEGARGDVSVEVVVIDNASGDGSADVSEALGARLNATTRTATCQLGGTKGRPSRRRRTCCS